MISLMDSPWEAETGKTAAAMKKKTKTKYLMGVSGNRRSGYRFVALPGEPQGNGLTILAVALWLVSIHFGFKNP